MSYSFFENKINGLSRRISSVKYGLFYWRNKGFKITENLIINGKRTSLKTDEINMNEFALICMNDCYRLKFLKKKLSNIKTIVDVGANHGLFVIAARQCFPDAKIHCYEPNPHLVNTLSYNSNKLNATVFFEAVMKNDCQVNLQFFESDLATISNESEGGNVTGSSLKTVIKRIGSIDILKLDCEGAEWELLRDMDSWKHIKALTMEYHLWGKKDSKVADLFKMLDAINFQSVHHTIYNSQQGLIAAINKTIL